MRFHKTGYLLLPTILSFALLSLPAWAEKYKLDADHTKIEFKVKHLVISTVTGRFQKFEGEFEYDPKKSTLKAVEIKINTSSINTDNEKRDAHLRQEDFFHTAKHPSAMFTLKTAQSGVKKGKSKKLTGELTLRGVTKPVKLKVTYLGSVTDGWKNKKLVFKAVGEINRKDFGIKWNKNLDSGGLMVSEKVELEIDGQAYLQE